MPKIGLECMGCRKTLSFTWPDDQEVTFIDSAQAGYDKGWRMSRGEWFCGSRCVTKTEDRVDDAFEEATLIGDEPSDFTN